MNSKQKTIVEYEKVLQSAITPYKREDCHFFLAVSGGVDSVVMSSIFLEWSKKQGVEATQITILHYNHNQRENSGSDAFFVRSLFPDYQVIVDHWLGGKTTETVLREARFLFFNNNCKKVISGGKCFLLLGHHLDDRIETTLMNIHRGCDLPGMINMGTIQDAWFNTDITIIRPLLGFSKSEIYEFARGNTLSFVHDSTNFIPHHTWRNTIRQTINLSMGEYREMSIFYNELENILQSGLDQVRLRKLHRDYTFGYEGYGIDILTDIDSKFILWKLGFYSFSAGFLQEFTSFLTIDSGIIMLNNTIFMRSLKKLYWFNTQNRFRTVKKTEEDKDVQYITGGDRWRGQSLKRYLMEKGVPLFARNSVQVTRKNGLIVEITIPTEDDIYAD